MDLKTVSVGYPDSYYAASRTSTVSRPVLDGDRVADVCIVGGGLTGISAAVELAERGLDVVVVEGARIGWGASGRSGGQALVGYAAGIDRIEALVGCDGARALWDMSVESVRLIMERTTEHRISCDLKWGALTAVCKARDLDGYRREIAHLAEVYGYEKMRVIGRDETRQAVASDRYAGGILDAGSGHLHPLNYCLGLADAAEKAGAEIFEQTPVLSLKQGPMPAAVTATGTVRCRHLVLACNAYLDDLAPAIGARIMPVGTYIAATEPLGAERARALIPDDLAICDDRFVLDYYRLSADSRLLFGGRVSYSTLDPADLANVMRRKMIRVFPKMADARIDHVWGGYVGITRNRLPDFGKIGDTVLYAHGFSGHGVALTGLAGRVIAEAVAGQAGRFDLFAKIPHRPFPGGRRLRTPMLVVAMAWLRLRDLL